MAAVMTKPMAAPNSVRYSRRGFAKNHRMKSRIVNTTPHPATPTANSEKT